jgi:peroxiredoxin
MNKSITLLFITLNVSLHTTKAQINKDSIDRVAFRKENILKGLRKMDGQEININEPSNLNPKKTPLYTEDYTRLTKEELQEFMKPGEYAPDAYVDANNKIKIYVLRKRSEQEKMIISKIQIKLKEMDATKSLVNETALDFTVTDIKGQKYILEEMKGKIVVINFWFVECKPCVREIPELNKLVEKYKDQGVIFLGIATNDKEQINAFLQHTSFSYNIIPNSTDIAELYKINTYPSHIVIDKNSKIVHHTTGLESNTIRNLNKKIQSLL